MTLNIIFSVVFLILQFCNNLNACRLEHMSGKPISKCMTL